MVGFLGWAVFGNAWHGVKSGCRRVLQIGALFLACLIAHYIWAVCYPVVSIIVACLMAVVWVCRKMLRLVGTVIFHVHRLAGGAPEASDVEFYRPGTGVVPETSDLRSFKRTGDAVKQVVVRRGNEVAVFNVGSDVQNIRTHGLFLPVEADTVRGSPSLVRKIAVVDKVHLCRNVVCGEEVGEHFTEYGVVRKFNPEKFQVAHSHQGAMDATRNLWQWLLPRGKQTVNEVVSRIREYASESETEEQLCSASRLSWKTADGVQFLAESRCTAVKENSYKVGVCFFQVGVQIRRQVSWLNYYSARLFCWIAQRKVDTDASVLVSLSLLSIFGTSCCSCIHIICYNMTSTIYDPFCSCIIIETYLADRAAITFVQNKPRLQTKVYLGIFSFAH